MNEKQENDLTCMRFGQKSNSTQYNIMFIDVTYNHGINFDYSINGNKIYSQLMRNDYR